MTSIALRLIALLLITSGVALTGNAQTDEPYLATLSIERAGSDDTPLGELVRFDMHVNDPQATAASFAKIEGLTVLEVGQDTVTIVAIEAPTAAAATDEYLRSSTFVIDYDEQSMLDLLNKFQADYGSSISTADMVNFVFEYIDDKTYARSFDFASKVAASGAGDCTEHAVLLAALARANGLYARVIFGTLILDLDGGLAAYGHAWTEIHDGTRWQIRDATLPADDSSAPRMRYLPVSVLTNEGPGYSFSMLEIMNAMPSRISGVENQD